MAQRTDQLERDVFERRAQLADHLEQLQARMDHARDVAQERFRRVSWGVLLTGAAVCGYSIFRFVRRSRTPPAPHPILGALRAARRRR